MTMKLMFWMTVFLINIGIATAQTGLFVAETGNTFLITGVTIIVTILVISEIVRRFRKRK